MRARDPDAQLRNTAVKFVSRVIPDVGMAIRTRPLEVLIIGACVRGLSDRDIESLLEEAGQMVLAQGIEP